MIVGGGHWLFGLRRDYFGISLNEGGRYITFTALLTSGIYILRLWICGTEIFTFIRGTYETPS